MKTEVMKQNKKLDSVNNKTDRNIEQQNKIINKLTKYK